MAGKGEDSPCDVTLCCLVLGVSFWKNVRLQPRGSGSVLVLDTEAPDCHRQDDHCYNRFPHVHIPPRGLTGAQAGVRHQPWIPV